MPISSNQDWSERHRSAVRESAPEVPGLSEGEQRALWHQIEARVAPAEVRRARWKTVAAGVVAVVAVGGVGAAAANVLSARTGTFPSMPRMSSSAGLVSDLTRGHPTSLPWWRTSRSMSGSPRRRRGRARCRGRSRVFPRARTLPWCRPERCVCGRRVTHSAHGATPGRWRCVPTTWPPRIGPQLWSLVRATGRRSPTQTPIWRTTRVRLAPRPRGGHPVPGPRRCEGGARRSRGVPAGAGPRVWVGQAVVKQAASRADVERLYHLHAGELRGYLHRRAGEAGADLLGDVFVVALQRLGDLPEPDLRRAWLFGTSPGGCCWPRNGTADTSDVPSTSMSGSTNRRQSPRATTPTACGAVRDALASLREQDRELIRLTEWEQLTTSEAAAVLGLRPGTARVRLHRARRALASHPALQGLFDQPSKPEQVQEALLGHPVT